VAVPEPKPGLIIRYDYLWLREAALGRDQGKDRQACLVAASDSSSRPCFVVILPISIRLRQVHYRNRNSAEGPASGRAG